VTYSACQTDDTRSFAYQYVSRAKQYYDSVYAPCVADPTQAMCKQISLVSRQNTMQRYIEWMDTQRLFYRFLSAERR
jgi:hypothetical protein